jgi:hypothetical protein
MNDVTTEAKPAKTFDPEAFAYVSGLTYKRVTASMHQLISDVVSDAHAYKHGNHSANDAAE